jgi:DNA-binding NarL/FixJ family response regulator
MVSLGERRTCVVLDDHPLWLFAVEGILERVGIDVVGKTRSAEEALDLLQATKADLFISDVRFEDGRIGLACVREAVKRFPDLNVIVVSAVGDPAAVDEALSAGADAFISKTVHPEDFASAVRQVFSHSVFLATGPRPNRHGRQSNRLPGLTRREAEILDLVSEGHTNGQVARMLWVTEQTVKFHLSNIYRKLGVANRTEASHWALINQLRGGDGDESLAVRTGQGR